VFYFYTYIRAKNLQIIRIKIQNRFFDKAKEKETPNRGSARYRKNVLKRKELRGIRYLI